jgi:putative chitinase
MDLNFPDRFFRTVRVIMHPRVSQKQVNGINTIVKVWDGDDLRHLAYILATAKRECNFILDIREVGRGAGKTYGKRDPVTGHAYYGRGPVQLTWKANYDKMGKALGLDLVNNPDLMLKPENGVKAMIIGMERGMFTGKKLDDYLFWAEDFEDDRQDAYNARRIVNGVDAAREIEDNYYLFKVAVLEGLHGY